MGGVETVGAEMDDGLLDVGVTDKVGGEDTEVLVAPESDLETIKNDLNKGYKKIDLLRGWS